MAVILFCLISYLSARAGGINSPATAWYVAIPVLCTMMLGYRSGVAWLVLTLAVMPILFIEQRSHWEIARPPRLQPIVHLGCGCGRGHHGGNLFADFNL